MKKNIDDVTLTGSENMKEIDDHLLKLKAFCKRYDIKLNGYITFTHDEGSWVSHRFIDSRVENDLIKPINTLK